MSWCFTVSNVPVSANGGSDGRRFGLSDFYVKLNGTKKVIFLDEMDESNILTFFVHEVAIGDRFGCKFTCSRDANCLWCQNKSPSRLYLMLSLLEFSEGFTIRKSMFLCPFVRQEGRLTISESYARLKAIVTRKNISLKYSEFVVSRVGLKTAPRTGNDFDYIRTYTLDELKNKLMEYNAKNIDFLVKPFGKDDIAPLSIDKTREIIQSNIIDFQNSFEKRRQLNASNQIVSPFVKRDNVQQQNQQQQQVKVQQQNQFPVASDILDGTVSF